MPANFNDEILTVGEASRLMKVSPHTIRHLIDSGKIRAVKIGFGTQRQSHRVLKSSILELFGIQPLHHGKAKGE